MSEEESVAVDGEGGRSRLGLCFGLGTKSEGFPEGLRVELAACLFLLLESKIFLLAGFMLSYFLELVLFKPTLTDILRGQSQKVGDASVQ